VALKQVLLRGGGVTVEDVPAPGVGEKNILVRVSYSCISVGTELAGMAAAAIPLYKRALKQPANIMRAFKMMQEQGVSRTVNRIRGMLTTGRPTGYSASGVIIAVGHEVEGFKVGDRVACAGAGIANHAEIISVPVNLAVRVPGILQLDLASTVTLGAIAMQGVRRAAPTLGETIAVIGLGILGQITVQLLKANGCNVIGTDVSPSRIRVARECGMAEGIDPAEQDVVERINWLTDGMGADAVIITAAASNHEIISQAMRSCRRKGRVVLVGDVGLNLKREEFYRKEIDFLVSTSYGPGRYDPYYEEAGQDYPLPYVRWTENRNMGAYLDLLASNKIQLAPLQPQIFDVDSAQAVYETLSTSSAEKPLLVLLRYPVDSEIAPRRSIALRKSSNTQAGRIGVAVIGAGGFAQAVHLPNLIKLRNVYDLRWIVSRTGSSAGAAAKQFEVPNAGTDWHAVLEDPTVDLLLVTTRHHLHAGIALQALKAGKHVFVEKPLALNAEELSAIEAFYAEGHGEKPVLMTGFNRRFAPPVQYIKKILADHHEPMMISYRMNAGYLPPDHWVHGPEGGGRNIGEACHIYDLFTYLTGAEALSCSAASINRPPAGTRPNENFFATISYSDGSVATLMYTALGSKNHPKERMDIYIGCKVISLDDYRIVSIDGGRYKTWSSTLPQKGQFEELQALASVIRAPQQAPESLADQFMTTRLSFSIEELLAPSR
jgi:predicted dehydrogenase/threonine dehydrogenase-like Zn-dependent dehydrogenase